MTPRLPIVLAGAVLAVTPATAQAPSAAPEPTAAQLAFFENEVRPLLAERCFECHGPRVQKSGMRLDHIDFVRRGGSRGPALVPGHPERSRMIEAVRYGNVDLQMPPKNRLPAAAVRTLERWIAMGAPWPAEPRPAAPVQRQGFDLQQRRREHWAWQPRRRSQPPVVDDPAWRHNPIDRFIFAGLQRAGLRPAGLAARSVLLRRVTFDLTGLPPTPEELDAFLDDPAPDAYAKVVDRLLASPRFGERWARHWLDLVRYAETLGHEFDYPIPNAWRYRDYVIRALNADLPYDQFVREHIAGDLLEPPRRHPTEGFNESILATAFWWFPEQSHSPVDVRKATADRTDSQIDTFAKTFVGLTVACARCHDHKFDAIPTSDYYALSGFLKSSRYLQRDARAAVDQAALAAMHRTAKELRAAWADALRQAAGAGLPYLRTAAGARLGQPAEPPAGLDAGLLKRWQAAVQDKTLERDRSHPLHGLAILQQRKDPNADVRAAWRQRLAGRPASPSTPAATRSLVDFARDGFDGWRTEGVAFGNGPVRGQTMVHSDWFPTAVHAGGVAHSGARGLAAQGVLHSPEFTIDKPYLHVLAHGRDSRIKVVLEGFHLIRNPIYGTLKQVVQSTTPRWYTVDLRMWPGRRAALVLCDQEPHDLADSRRYRRGGYLAVARAVLSDHRAPPPLHGAIDRAALGGDGPVRDLAGWLDALGAGITAAADALAAGGVDSHQARLLNWLWEKDLVPGGPQVDELRRRYLAIRPVPEPMFVPAIADGSGLDEHVFIRGSHNNLGPLAPRRFLSAIAGTDQPPLGRQGSGRRQLAERLLAADNPFPSRVLVNRLWHHLFGRGIVPTVDNFGVLGEAPSHPQLLDWLARRFVADGWSIKQAIRRMVLSRTYRLASQSDADRDARDPGLRWRHRMAVRRLSGEAIRDAILHVSGRLDPQMYGPGVPVHLTRFMTGRGRPGRSGPLDGAGRRSIYLGVSRNFLHPFLLAFDFPAPSAPMGRRAVTNVPAQALAMLNDPFIKEQAAVWSKRVGSGTGAAADRLRTMYRQAYSRLPQARELDLALGFLRRQAAAHGGDQNDPRPWQDLCHALWNAKEFLFLR